VLGLAAFGEDVFGVTAQIVNAVEVTVIAYIQCWYLVLLRLCKSTVCDDMWAGILLNMSTLSVLNFSSIESKSNVLKIARALSAEIQRGLKEVKQCLSLLSFVTLKAIRHLCWLSRV